MTMSHGESLTDRVLKLTTAEKFILAAEVLRAGDASLARLIAERALDELTLARLTHGLRR